LESWHAEAAQRGKDNTFSFFWNEQILSFWFCYNEHIVSHSYDCSPCFFVGLPILRTAPAALAVWDAPKNVELFDRLGVLTPKGRSRCIPFFSSFVNGNLCFSHFVDC
jgi:hypothetical protein